MSRFFRQICCAVLSGLMLLTGCNGSGEPREFPTASIREGDLAFRCGRGVFSRAVTLSEEEGVYSHVGVVVQEQGKWKVVHSVPGEQESEEDFDRVKTEDLEVFFSPRRACRGALVHTGLTEPSAVGLLRKEAMRMAADSVRFDHSYCLKDSSEVYCTEFVWLLYKRLGIDLSEGRRRHVHLFNINDDVILPEHLLHYSEHSTYYTF